VVRTRSGDPYKPSALRAYKQVLDQRLLPALGAKRLTAITSTTLQDLVDHLVAEKL
jgi:Phage integrase, N-terminal SAM-like domain